MRTLHSRFSSWLSHKPSWVSYATFPIYTTIVIAVLGIPFSLFLSLVNRNFDTLLSNYIQFVFTFGGIFVGLSFIMALGSMAYRFFAGGYFKHEVIYTRVSNDKDPIYNIVSLFLLPLFFYILMAVKDEWGHIHLCVIRSFFWTPR